MTRTPEQVAEAVLEKHGIEKASASESPFTALGFAMGEDVTYETAMRDLVLTAQSDSLVRVKTALHRLADRIEHDDENTVKVPLSEILMYTDENRANIARMLRREADSF
jgi:hypothetical protein